MTQQLANTILRMCHRGADRGGDESLTDRQLLARFAQEGNRRAFAVLVRRYGPMVHGALRRTLDRSQDIEDAFQTTFVILARKAGVQAWQDSVCNWLYGVALRVALKLKNANAGRRQGQS